VSLNIDIYSFGNNFFQKLAGALQQADGLISLCLAVIGLVRFVEDDHRGLLPWVDAQIYG